MNNIVITGASGAIGSALVPVLLEDAETQLHLILRADSSSHLEQRTQSLLDYWSDSADTPVEQFRLCTYRGDVCRPQLGLDRDIHALLLHETTHFIHCAGNVKLNQSIDAARRSAVDGVRHVLDFARRAGDTGQLRKVDVTSTVGIGGRTRGIIEERRYTEPRQFRNTYEAAKAESEELLWEEIERGVPLTIHRPSMVVGDSLSGQIIHFQVFYFLAEFLTGKHTRGILPAFGDATLDIIPADHVARAIALASRSNDTIGRPLHLCSGPELAIRLDDLSGACRQIYISEGQQLPRARQVPQSLVKAVARIAPLLVRGKLQRSLRTLPYFLDYLDEPQSFAVTETNRLLAPLGYAVPPPQDYLPTILHPYLQASATNQRRPTSSRPRKPQMQSQP